MGIKREIRRINPLELNKSATIGVAFPLDENNLFYGTENIKKQVRSNLINILLTIPGERINLPKFGVGLKNYLFENNINLNILKERIKLQLRKHLPRITLEGIKIDRKEDNEHVISLTVIYRNQLDRSRDIIQLNFS